MYQGPSIRKGTNSNVTYPHPVFYLRLRHYFVKIRSKVLWTLGAYAGMPKGTCGINVMVHQNK
jgi:hypothetical protein